MPGRKLVALMIAAWVMALVTVRDFRAALAAGDGAFAIVNVGDGGPSLPGSVDTDSDHTRAELHPVWAAFCAAVCVIFLLWAALPRSRRRTGDSLYCTLVASTGGTGLLSPPPVAA